MNSKLLIGLLGAGIIFGGAVAAGASEDTLSKKGSTKNQQEMLTIEEAKNIALKKVNGTLESVELENTLTQLVYEVDIDKQGTDYDVYVDAYSGEVLAIKKDNDDLFDDNRKVVNSVVENGKSVNNAAISENEAISIAEKAVNGKTVEIELEYDDGMLQYKIELQTNRGEAEVEIDAETGKILETEWDD